MLVLKPSGFFISFYSTLPFTIMQLRSPALFLVAIAGSVSAAIGPIAVLPILSETIAPDGYSRQ